MSSFDPNQFLDVQITEANDTKLVPVPEAEYTAVIDKVTTRAWQGKADPSKSGVTLEVLWDIDDTALKAELGRDKITVKQGIMLDLTDSGSFDMGKGKNVGLGRLREALDMNKPGIPFAFSMLPGRVATVSVKHRIVEDAIYAEVRGVAPMA